MEISKQDATFLLEAILQKPVTTNVESVIKGVQAQEYVINIIKNLQKIMEEPVLDPNQVQEAPVEAAAEVVEATEAPEQA